jgi:hypothetical protein
VRIAQGSLVALLAATLVWFVSTANGASGSAGACRAGTKRAVVGGKVKCLKPGQACKARYRAAYKKVGLTCVKGRLRKVPPPAPPPPPAQAGHYHGTTSQLEVIDFDVAAGGRSVTNATTGQINQGCNPPLHLSGGGLLAAAAPIAADGTFTIQFDYQSTVSGAPSSGHFSLTGRFSGQGVGGTLTVTTTFTANGVAYTCGSGQQTWTANRTGP